MCAHLLDGPLILIMYLYLASDSLCIHFKSDSISIPGTEVRY